MDYKDILDNLTEENELIKAAIEKQIPKEPNVCEDWDEDENGKPYRMDIYSCPICNKTYRMFIPMYCRKCGQRLEGGRDV